jgi:hypothetical protein
LPDSSVPLSSSLVAIKGSAAPIDDMPTRSAAPPAKEDETEETGAPLNFRVSAEFRREFKTYAAAHDLELNKLLALSFETYRRQNGDYLLTPANEVLSPPPRQIREPRAAWTREIPPAVAGRQIKQHVGKGGVSAEARHEAVEPIASGAAAALASNPHNGQVEFVERKRANAPHGLNAFGMQGS